MSITADMNGKNYTLGRGRVLFDRFDGNAVIDDNTKGEGYRYIGNTPEFSMAGSADNLDHYDSDGGVKVKDDSVQLTMDRTGKFSCDNIDRENIALLFGGTASDLVTAAAANVAESIVVTRGRIYQLGESAANPSGNRKVTIVTVKKGGVDLDPASFQVDADLGQLYILPAAADVQDGDSLDVTYSVAASTRGQVVSGSQSIYGQIKFVAANPRGVNRDYYLPYVKLAPDGDYNLKGDDWLKMGFTMQVLKRGSLEAVYVDERAA